MSAPSASPRLRSNIIERKHLAGLGPRDMYHLVNGFGHGGPPAIRRFWSNGTWHRRRIYQHP